jgi:hypothetical protein
MAISLSSIVNISLRRSFKSIWQLLNLRYLYNLLYPFIAADFRSQLDCTACVLQVKNHCHHVNKTLAYPTFTPIEITPALGLAQINVDPLSKLPARVGVAATVQPFDVLSNLNNLKPNIGLELNLMPELDQVMDDASKIQKASKFFSLK